MPKWNVPEYEFIEVETVSAIAIRRKCNSDDLAKIIPEMFDQISRSNPDAEMIAPPMVKYYDWTPPTCEIETACPVTTETKAAGRNGNRKLPGLHGSNDGTHRPLPKLAPSLVRPLEIR